MRLASILGIMAAAACLTAPSQGLAQDGVLNPFRAFCYDNPGNLDATLAAADAAGWDPAPRAMFDAPGNPFQDTRGRVRSNEDAMMIVMVGTMVENFEGTPVTMQACMIVSVPATIGFGEEFREWAGADPSSAFGDTPVPFYAIEIRPDGARLVRSDLNQMQAARLILNNQLHIMAGANEGESSMAMYMVPIVPE